MAKADTHNLKKIAEQAEHGDSNAFAVIFASTYKEQYAFACRKLGDIYLAQDALEKIYVHAHGQLSARSAQLDRWLTDLNRIVCGELLRERAKKNAHITTGKNNVPFDSNSPIPDRGSNGPTDNDQKHSRSTEPNTASDSDKNNSATDAYVLREDIAEQLLDKIISDLKMPKRTLTLQHAHLYNTYRRETSIFRRVLPPVILAAVLFVPLMFIKPSMELRKVSNADAAGRPVYFVSVRSLSGTESLIATIDGVTMPVYQEAAGTYSIRPTRDGLMQITLTTKSRRHQSMTQLVDLDDTTPPELVSQSTDDGVLTLQFSDTQNAVSVETLTALYDSGKKVKPLSVDVLTQTVTFDIPTEPLTIRVSDETGNTLRLTVNP